MVYFTNKNLHGKEFMLLDEKKLLEAQEEELKKRRAGFLTIANVNINLIARTMTPILFSKRSKI
jgi:hypothetical protein